MNKPETILAFAAPPVPYFIECGIAVYDPGDQHPSRKQLGLFDFIVIERGSLHIGEENKQWTLQAGQSLVLRPDLYHYSVKPCEEACSFYWVHFHTAGKWQEGSGESFCWNQDEHLRKFMSPPYYLHLPKYWSMPYPNETYRLMERLVRASGERQSSAFWSRQQTFEELLRMMDLRQLEQYAPPAIVVAEKTEAYLRNHYQSGVTSQSLSEALHYHYNYITRCMKQVYGMTPGEYLTHYRLEQAKLLLLKTEWPIAEIGRFVGFENIPYFTNSFTAKNGMSPRQFRQSYSMQ
ncbi:helix-turn-helix domain-containing protein [Paenibacillus protaetiae]|uniref:AraC family transcriptional regulator n=1 Tax=Paenibacillus protaetiae TaxID=2509456 RepID=A0A4P6F0Y7_9BACL|nr:AraC family transcriptional regulator [Paenibacillus protaetiae]QAY66677.1 AraC family transcriptional regulator [Paenibacillus protaetiae]